MAKKANGRSADEVRQIKPLLKFIADAQDGKYTKEKPTLVQIDYMRLQIQEQDNPRFTDNNGEDFLLFGIS
jgi:hypothetical protein